MAAEEDFVLSFTGEETDNLLKHTESMKNQTTEEDGETVQVYDTNGVPHKVSKTELLKKSTLALPALEDISSFVAINAAGNAVGVMTKEQVASVLAELIPFPFAYRGRKVIDANNVDDGYYYAENGSTNTNGYFGILISMKADQSTFQILVEIFSGTPYQRAKKSDGQWTEWKQL